MTPDPDHFYALPLQIKTWSQWEASHLMQGQLCTRRVFNLMTHRVVCSARPFGHCCGFSTAVKLLPERPLDHHCGANAQGAFAAIRTKLLAVRDAMHPDRLCVIYEPRMGALPPALSVHPLTNAARLALVARPPADALPQEPAPKRQVCHIAAVAWGMLSTP